MRERAGLLLKLLGLLRSLNSLALCVGLLNRLSGRHLHLLLLHLKRSQKLLLMLLVEAARGAPAEGLHRLRHGSHVGCVALQVVALLNAAVVDDDRVLLLLLLLLLMAVRDYLVVMASAEAAVHGRRRWRGTDYRPRLMMLLLLLLSNVRRRRVDLVHIFVLGVAGRKMRPRVWHANVAADE